MEVDSGPSGSAQRLVHDENSASVWRVSTCITRAFKYPARLSGDLTKQLFPDLRHGHLGDQSIGSPGVRPEPRNTQNTSR